MKTGSARQKGNGGERGYVSPTFRAMRIVDFVAGVSLLAMAIFFTVVSMAGTMSEMATFMLFIFYAFGIVLIVLPFFIHQPGWHG